MKKLQQKIALTVTSTVLTLGAALLLGHCIHINGASLNKKMALRAWHIKKRFCGDPRIGIFQADSAYGFKHIPLSVGHHSAPLSYDVTYTIDERGNRTTPQSYQHPKILILGCSYTFGHGVEDNENYAWLLAEKLPGFKVENGGTMAWGTIQAWLKLQKELSENDDTRLVIYSYITDHARRNYLDKKWLETLWKWEKQNPHYELEKGKLVSHGLANAEKDGISDKIPLELKEVEITKALIKDMAATCKFRNIPFLVAHLPDGSKANFNLDFLPLESRPNFIDLRKCIDSRKIENRVDGHPSPEGHKMMAERLEPVILNLLGSQAKSSKDN